MMKHNFFSLPDGLKKSVRNTTVFSVLVVMMLSFQNCKDSDDEPEVLPPIVLECDYFTEDRVLEDDPNRPVDYIVPCVATVNGDIVVNAGVVIEFENDGGLNIKSGSLKAEGTADKKVVFTGVSKIKGSWRGLYFQSKSVNNSLNHAIVSYAGGNSFNSNNERANVICSQGRLSITNSELSQGKEHGFNAPSSNTDLDAFDQNVITGNDKYPVYSRTDYGHWFAGGNIMTGNGNDFIYLRGNQATIAGDRTWSKSSVPYLIEGVIKIRDTESLTLDAGTDLRFEFNGSIDIAAGGFLAVNGTSGNKVTLTGLTAQPGAWKGIINFSGDPRNVIDYADISYAGGGAHNSNGDLGTIIVWANAYQKVSNSILRDAAANADCAINAYNSATVEVDGNAITNITTELCN